MSNCFDVRHSNVEGQNDTNVKHQTVLTFDIRMSNVNLYDLNVKSQNGTNVER